MSTNSLTFADATGIRSDQARDLADDYAESLRLAARAVLDGFDDLATYAYDKARRIAHRACEAGNPAPLLDQLYANLEIDGE